MPFNAATLTVWLAASGVSEGEEHNLDLVFAQQLVRQELGRDSDRLTAEGILGALKNGMQLSDVRVALRGSYERLVTDNHVAGRNSDAFRKLSAHSSIEGLAASSAEVAEGIAAYRLILGREPELSGFASFLARRRTHSLAVAVRDIVGSAEAAENFAPDQPSTISVMLPAVLSVAGQVLHAAASDTTLGSMANLGAQVGTLAARLAAMEQKIDRLTELVLLRLDAEAVRQ